MRGIFAKAPTPAANGLVAIKEPALLRPFRVARNGRLLLTPRRLKEEQPEAPPLVRRQRPATTTQDAGDLRSNHVATRHRARAQIRFTCGRRSSAAEGGRDVGLAWNDPRDVMRRRAGRSDATGFEIGREGVSDPARHPR